MKSNATLFPILFFLIGSYSCIIPKEARQLKRTTKNWRESPVVLSAYADSPLPGTFLTLRENKKFEHTSSGMLQCFEAGNWTNNQDTIYLSYVDQTQKITQQQKCILIEKHQHLFLTVIQ